MAVAGVLIALLAPVLGQGTDRSGRRMFHLRWQTWALAAVSAALWFVAPGQQYLWLGLALLGIGNIVSEVANVNYYAAIDQMVRLVQYERILSNNQRQQQKPETFSGFPKPHWHR